MDKPFNNRCERTCWRGDEEEVPSTWICPSLWKSGKHGARLSRQGEPLDRWQKNYSAQLHFDGLHVWEKDGIFPQSLEQSSSKFDRLIEGAEH